MSHRLCRSAAAWAFLWGAGATLALAQGEPLRVSSPDGAIEVRLLPAAPAEAGAPPRLAYEVSFHGKPLMDTSLLELRLQGQRLLGAGLTLVSSRTGSVDESYAIPAGKSRTVRNHYNSLVAEYRESGVFGRRLNVEVRAYDDGVAFRYVVPETAPPQEIRIEDEATEFRFARDAEAYPLILRGFRTSYEDQYHRMTLSGIHPESLVALPFLVDQPGVGWVAITEAHLEGYAGLYLTHPEGTTMRSRLAPRADEPEIAVSGVTPLRSPWRVLMIGEDPGRLVESSLVLNLNPPCAIADTSWIRAGKTAWDWWSGTWAEGVDFEPGMNTATMEHYVDFAAEAGLEFMLIDAGWSERGEPGRPGDITRTVPAIDLPEILRHAKAKGVGVWLWLHWTAVERQMDEAFPLYEKWGVAGLKIDFMDRDDQWMVDFYHRVLDRAAAHHLMIDFHGAYKPDGIRRTYPNLLTREGVMGLEYVKWSARTNPDHDVMLAFTRMLAGPMDYTPGGFRNVTRAEFEPRRRQPLVMGTRAHQLALYVVFESPLMMVSDDPEAYRGEKDFDFIRAAPTSWDETRVLGGEVGEYVILARRRGGDWYVGAITGWTPRTVRVPLVFLGSGRFVAEIYADAADAATEPRHTTIERKTVTAATELTLSLAPGGGAAIRVHP
jgi:alpha-glucosidase